MTNALASLYTHSQERNEDDDDETPVMTTVRWRGAEIYASS